MRRMGVLVLQRMGLNRLGVGALASSMFRKCGTVVRFWLCNQEEDFLDLARLFQIWCGLLSLLHSGMFLLVILITSMHFSSGIVDGGWPL